MIELIELNDGSKLFWTSQADARAVQALWKTSLADAPSHLSHQDLPAYAQAWLTAQAVKVDLLRFLHSLWSAIWLGHDDCLGALTLDEIAEAGRFDDSASVDWVTDGDDDGSDRAFYGVVKLRSGELIECIVGLTDDGSLNLWAGIMSEAWRASACRLSKRWGEESEDLYIYARHVGRIENGSLSLVDSHACVAALLNAPR